MVSLMPGYRRGETIAWREGRAISHQHFLAQTLRLAETLPDAPYLINLCEDRYRFMLTLCASLLRDAVTLLPPNRLAPTVREVAARHPGAVALSDGPIGDLGLPHVEIQEPALDRDEAPASAPRIADRPDGIIVFTSGSTGSPRPHPKRWRDQMRCSRHAAARFEITSDTSFIATVPPQHMYGLELSVLIPLATGAAAHSGQPFFPEDIRRALARTAPPRVLVTTPVHLNACVKANLEWPEIEFLVSATAPLSMELARAVETAMHTRVFEIYGCTEAGSVASRRTVEGPTWRWYDSVAARGDQDSVTLTADFLPGTIPLSDVLRVEDACHFRLLGRGGDMVNIAGKRASLADLNLKLNAVPGVEEGLLLIPDAADEITARLAAVVVAPSLDRAALVARLRECLDPVFIPRPIRFVDSLPRNEVGKTPRQWLLQLLNDRRDAHGADRHDGERT